jgi:hypothetical protein
MPSGPPAIIEDVHNMGPWSTGLSCMRYYAGQVARIIRNLSLKGLDQESKVKLLLYTGSGPAIRSLGNPRYLERLSSDGKSETHKLSLFFWMPQRAITGD